MTVVPATVSLLVFEAADCLMAVPAAEIKQLDRRSSIVDRRSSGLGNRRSAMDDGGSTMADRRSTIADGRSVDLTEYFTGCGTDGPWLCWTRGARSAWLRVRRVVDVVPVALAALTPLPRLLRGQSATNAFLAAGIRDDEVFLLLDPARLDAGLPVEASR